MGAHFTIGRLAKAVRVNIQTVRYYERLNLIEPTERKLSGYRLYDEATLKRLQFIKNAQALGFTLREVTELLDLRVDSSAQCGPVRRKASEKLRQVERKVRDLQALARSLRALIRTCESGRPGNGCPIVQSLEEQRRKSP